MNHLAEDVIESIWFITRQDRDVIDDRFLMKMIEWTSHMLCEICSRQEQEAYAATARTMRTAFEAELNYERVKFMNGWVGEGFCQTDDELSDRITDIENINLAELVISYLLELLLNAEDRYFDPELTRKEVERLSVRFASTYSPAERQALAQCARKTLAYYQQEPDEYGFTPRRLLEPDKKEVLDNLIAGKFQFHLKPQPDFSAG